jgi:hypothetical protein
MKRNLPSHADAQVFLNYPCDTELVPLANAMHFAVVATGMLPVCALSSLRDYIAHLAARLATEGTGGGET